MLCLLLPVEQINAQASDQLIQSIMALRSEVEQLYSQLQDGKADHRANMRSFAAQITDLEAQINRQQISLRQLELDAAKTQLEIDDASVKSVSIRPQLERGLGWLRQLIVDGLPFRIPERLEDLDKLRAQLDNGSISEERALGRVWATYEDLIRMSRENTLSRQEIVLEGEPVLAKVAKVGSIMLFFATPADEVGFAQRQIDGTVVYKRAETLQQQEQILSLFDAFEKQIRSGYFTLPSSSIFAEP